MQSPQLAPFQLNFPTGIAQTVCVSPEVNLMAALETIGLNRSRPTLVLTGGATHLDLAASQRLQEFFHDCLVPLAEKLHLTVIDGGTDAGVMRLMGMGRSAQKATFPLVGVAPANKIHLPDTISGLETIPRSGTHPLEPHHTHFVLTPGLQWGAESPWIAQIATILAGNQPSMTLLVNGGTVSLMDVQASLAEHRPVFVLAGSGRLADEIATTMRSAYPPHLSHPAFPACSPTLRELKLDQIVLLNETDPLEKLKDQLSAFFHPLR
jgi:hypothetical protein